MWKLFQVQWYYNGGRCGFCGDDYKDRQPRAHEIGGKYGQGTIVKSYLQGGNLPVKVQITANHKGYFYFQLCNLDKNRNRESDSCFAANKLHFTNGLDYYYLPHANPGWFDVTLKIPSGLTCNHCVLQWTYVTGNNWGDCGNGSGNLGCGPQEHFRGCSDIKIQWKRFVKLINYVNKCRIIIKRNISNSLSSHFSSLKQFQYFGKFVFHIFKIL